MNEKDILKQLVKFNTIKDKNNKEILDYIEKLLLDKGFNVDYRSKCLVISIKDEINLGFLGHTDTVKYGADWTFDPFEMKELKGNLYGLGTCDMKGGIAAIIKAVMDIDWEKCKKGIKLYFTYDEEIGFSGIRELIKRGEKFPDNMIIGEPTDNIIMNGSKGLLEYKILFNGKSAHSSMPEKGENAIEKCLNFMNELREFYNDLKNEDNDIFETGTTMNIGKINGGKRINIVPNNCEIQIDFRTISKDQNKRIIKKIEELTKSSKSTTEIINNICPFSNTNEKINMSDYITEASFIESSNKYILGVGPINAHKKDEFITIDSLSKLEKQYIELIKEKCEYKE